ncbi:MAG: hypothetical protein V4751_07205 [Pseudomonadota bacterium]
MSHANTPQAPATFTRNVLDRLQLDVCTAAQTLLLESVVATPSAATAQTPPLLAQHLQHCEQCRSLHAALLQCHAGLPALRARKAPSGFCQQVLRQTSNLARPPRAHSLSRLQSWLLRPRFALESAYVTSLLFVLLIDLPASNAIDMQRVEQQLDQQLQRLQTFVQERSITPQRNLSSLEGVYQRTYQSYQNGREQWHTVTAETTFWLQQHTATLMNHLKTETATDPITEQTDNSGAQP